MKNFLIEWTPEAEDWLDNQIFYLQENGFNYSLNVLAKDIDKKLKRLSKYPESGRCSVSDPEIRFIKIGKSVELYYLFNGSIVQLLTFFDTRQNPTKRPF